MNAMLKLALKTLVALLMLLVLFSVAMYVATSPKFTVPPTVKGDASIPAIEINGVRLHAEAFGREGAPVVIESNPAYPNLFGTIERQAWFGALFTDFTMIKPGALHRANGGYLILDARKLLGQPFAWEALKQALYGLRFDTPYGKELQRFVRHGVVLLQAADRRQPRAQRRGRVVGRHPHAVRAHALKECGCLVRSHRLKPRRRVH